MKTPMYDEWKKVRWDEEKFKSLGVEDFKTIAANMVQIVAPKSYKYGLEAFVGKGGRVQTGMGIVAARIVEPMFQELRSAKREIVELGAVDFEMLQNKVSRLEIETEKWKLCNFSSDGTKITAKFRTVYDDIIELALYRNGKKIAEIIFADEILATLDLIDRGQVAAITRGGIAFEGSEETSHGTIYSFAYVDEEGEKLDDNSVEPIPPWMMDYFRENNFFIGDPALASLASRVSPEDSLYTFDSKRAITPKPEPLPPLEEKKQVTANNLTDEERETLFEETLEGINANVQMRKIRRRDIHLSVRQLCKKFGIIRDEDVRKLRASAEKAFDERLQKGEKPPSKSDEGSSSKEANENGEEKIELTEEMIEDASREELTKLCKERELSTEGQTFFELKKTLEGLLEKNKEDERLKRNLEETELVEGGKNNGG